MARSRSAVNIHGERSMTAAFIARYAAEAARQVEGVYDLDPGLIASLKEALGAKGQEYGVEVQFGEGTRPDLSLRIFPRVYFGYVLPDLAWRIQEQVKSEIEKYTGLTVKAVNIEISGVVGADLLEADKNTALHWRENYENEGTEV